MADVELALAETIGRLDSAFDGHAGLTDTLLNLWWYLWAIVYFEPMGKGVTHGKKGGRDGAAT